MPIYEYYCPDNNRIYQFFAKTLAQAQATPNCPDDPAFRMVKMVSGFTVGGASRKSARADAKATGPAGEPGAAGGEGAAGAEEGPNADDPRMEAAFSQLEREMGSIDENDPRAMGRMMRRMSELTGERLDGEMEEMVRKLEEGADPEKLEQELGGALGEGEGGEDDGMGLGGGGFGGMPPSRDPHLYDF
jgi:hypothetical protein